MAAVAESAVACRPSRRRRRCFSPPEPPSRCARHNAPGGLEALAYIAIAQVTGVLPKSADGLTIVTLTDDEDAPSMVL